MDGIYHHRSGRYRSITNPGTYDLVLTNIGTNRWSLDNELMIEIVNMSDLTPPMTAGFSELLYVAEGDDVLVTVL